MPSAGARYRTPRGGGRAGLPHRHRTHTAAGWALRAMPKYHMPLR